VFLKETKKKSHYSDHMLVECLMLTWQVSIQCMCDVITSIISQVECLPLITLQVAHSMITQHGCISASIITWQVVHSMLT